tara:strand:+ start:24 stop:1178 length:1155 start_codon:yes stop_codon:yes gene_type:complete
MSNTRSIAHLLGQNHTATRFVDSADVDNIVGNSTYLNARNLVHNGAMYVDQRNEGAAVTPANATITFGPDRWFMYKNTAATFTIEQDTEAPAGFKYSLKVTNTGTDSSISATDRALIIHRLEGQDVYHLGLGTSGAVTVTLSFYVRSSITGTHGGAIRNHDSNQRNFPFTYTISSANTWERKSITLTLDTSGTWPSDNTLGLQIQFGLGVGTDFSGTADAWADGDKNSATGATTAMLSTSSATWYVTGIQLELGSIATPFEHLSVHQYQHQCLRYYYRYRKTIAYGMFLTTRSWSTTNADGIHSFPAAMRVAPTLSIDKTVNSTNFATGISVIAITEVEAQNFSSAGIRCTGSGFLALGGNVIQTNGASSAIDCSFNFDAEMTT